MALKVSQFINFQGLSEDFKSKNFSVYGQWNGILCIILCFIFGIANLFHVHFVVVFSAICIAQGAILIFVEIPFLLKICPLSDNFANFVNKFNQNWPRAIFYIIMSGIQWASIADMATSLIVPAIFLLISGIFYTLAAIKHQAFQNTSDVLNTSAETFPTGAVVREIL